MSGETENRPSGWTVDTLKQHYDSLRGTDKDALAAALQAVKEDNNKQAIAVEKRFDSVNEFRKTLSDQTASFLPRPEYDANHKALEDKIDTKTKATDDKIQALTDRINVKDGATQGVSSQKEQQNVSLGKIIAIVGISVTVASFFITVIVLAFNN